MFSPEVQRNYWVVSALLPVIYYFMITIFNISPVAFMRLADMSVAPSMYFAIYQPTTELAETAYRLAVGVHLLCLGAYTSGTGIPMLIGARHAYLVHYWMVFNVLGFFEAFKRRAPERRANAFYSFLLEFSTNPGLGCFAKTLAFIVSSAFFFVFVLVSFTLAELFTGVQIRRDPPGIHELGFFAIFTKMGSLIAEFLYFLLVTDFGLFGTVE
ncbi:unnamed protein product [Clonostachys rosea]|uniref:Uncharacterized protein n=1 Tax=Bionectria ochroleuca TaxID=29856 RepID=A0ABY6UCQ1_BIOOC|nr:unnamed protein product [Clonostachys rosea]